MVRHYLVLAVKVLLRRKFFTFISLFGISFTLLVLTVVAALFDHALGPGQEEPRQDRTLYVEEALMYGPHSTWGSNAGFKLLDRYARNLPGVERLSLLRERADGAHLHRRQEDQLGPEADRRRILAHPRIQVRRRDPLRYRRRGRSAFRRGDQQDDPRPHLRRPAGDRPDPRSRRAALPCDRRGRERVLDAHRSVRGYLGAVHHGQDRRIQARIMGNWNAMALAKDTGVDGGHSRRVQLAAASRRTARSQGLQGDRGAVRDPVCHIRPQHAAGGPQGSRKPGLAIRRPPHRARAALRAGADGQPREHQHQPHHGARVGNRRAQGVRRSRADARRPVPGREHPAHADRRR